MEIKEKKDYNRLRQETPSKVNKTVKKSKKSVKEPKRRGFKHLDIGAINPYDHGLLNE